MGTEISTPPVTPEDITRPRVVSTVPITTDPGPTLSVPTNTVITALFTEEMSQASIQAAGTVTVTCAPSCANGGTLAGTVSYAVGSRTMTFTPTPAGTLLEPNKTYTVTISTAATDVAGNALAGNQALLPAASSYIWSFTTAASPDITRPRVVSTVPITTDPGPTLSVPTNTLITALFTEEMAQASIQAAGTVTVTCTPSCVSDTLAGTVSYAVGSRTMTFTPTPAGTLLEPNKTYTVTISTAATDVAGNALAGNQAPLPAASSYIWSFTTAAAPIPAANITVASVFPVNTAPSVCPSSSISATFNVPNPILRINPLTVTASTFIVTGPGVSGPVVDAAAIDGRTVDVTGLIATFKPAAPLTPGLYTVTIKSGATGVTDTAIPGDQLAADYTWTFTVVPATGVCLAPIPLNSAEPFGALSCAALTGSTMGPTGTTINGDIGTRLTSTSITNFVGGGPPATPGIVNGTIYASDLPVAGDMTSATAVADAYLAYLAAQIIGLTGSVVPTSDLGAVAGFGPNPLTPGTYKAGAYQSGSSLAISTPMTLDAQGDANAVWIFYAPSSLTTSGLGSILLINNAQAKNVFWVVGSSATLSAPSFSGNVLAATAISVTTVGVTVDGRLLTSGPTCAAVTWDAHLHTVNVPAP